MHLFVPSAIAFALAHTRDKYMCLKSGTRINRINSKITELAAEKLEHFLLLFLVPFRFFRLFVLRTHLLKQL